MNPFRKFPALPVLATLLGAVVLGACQTPRKTSFEENIGYLERGLIAQIENEGPGERFVINRVQVFEEVVDWYTISLVQGREYSALSASGSSRVGAGSVVQICGWGEFLGIPIYTAYPYLCKRGEGLVFGVTRHGWVHLYGSGEVAGRQISIAKPH